MCICRRDSDETKYVYFLIKEEKAFDKYNEIWKKYHQKKVKSKLLYINLGNQFHFKIYIQKLHHVEYVDGK